ncbi:hypothetical protein [Maribacter sp.]
MISNFLTLDKRIPVALFLISLGEMTESDIPGYFYVIGFYSVFVLRLLLRMNYG